MNKGLELMQSNVLKSKTERINSGGVKVSEDGQTLAMHHPYYNFLFKVPYFHLLTVSEQRDVRRIFDTVNLDSMAKSIKYHYDNERYNGNGYSYVVDNLRYILSLPEPDDESLLVKFLMIATLGKMRFLSPRNINLVFAERHNVAEHLAKYEKSKTGDYLSAFFDLFSKINPRIIYSKKAEALYYLKMTFGRWTSHENTTLHEVVMMQEVFGHELPPASNLANRRTNVSISDFLNSFLAVFAEDYDKTSDPLKFLFDEEFSHGIINATMNEIRNYLSFFTWSAFDRDEKQTVCSFSRFNKEFPVKDLDEQVFSDLLVESKNSLLVPNMYYSHPDSKHRSYFLFCLLNGNEERFLELIDAMDNADMKSGSSLTEQERFDFLNMVKEYAECDYYIPMSLLFSLHGFDYS